MRNNYFINFHIKDKNGDEVDKNERSETKNEEKKKHDEKKQKVIIDTNFFLLPYQNNIDIFRLLEIVVDRPHSYVVSSRILSELKEIAKNKGKTGAAAKFGLKLLSMKEVDVVQSRMPVDEWIKKYAKENNAIVCTNDKKLKNKLKEDGILVITKKGKSWLGFV